MDDTVLLSTYIPNKLAKYGIKVFALADSTMFYISNFEIYCGKQRPGPLEGSNNSTDIVLRLIKPFDYKNSNLTTDNGNTSFPLSKMLLEKKIILLGTLKKKRSNKSRSHQYLFAFIKETTRVSFCTQKIRLLFLSMHNDDSVDPDIVLICNSAKGEESRHS